MSHLTTYVKHRSIIASVAQWKKMEFEIPSKASEIAEVLGVPIENLVVKQNYALGLLAVFRIVNPILKTSEQIKQEQEDRRWSILSALLIKQL